MGLMVDGVWTSEWYQPDEQGRFQRPQTQFRDFVTADGSSGYPAEADRYHLYVSWACPWAHRAIIMRRLKGLESAISLSVVDCLMGDDGWRFTENPECIPDIVNHQEHLSDIYRMANPHYTGRVTVPVLWDKERRTIVNNESREIMRMFDTEFDAFGDAAVNFCPEPLRARIDETIGAIYGPINDGVYRTGFAVTQQAYNDAVTELFEALDYWDGVLGNQRYLCGDVITEADWCMFTTLLRFDLAYVGHFKCNLRRLVDYPNLWNYVKELYQVPGVAETCNFKHIKNHYYMSHGGINPTRIVPLGPIINFNEPHDRDRLPGRDFRRLI
jgi:putative glutathione S-transferase